MAESWRNALGRDRLLISGFGKWGGGIYDLTSGAPHAYDDLATSGLTVGGGRVWRVLRAPGELTASCELLSYDERGQRTYQRLDDIRDPHDVCWHEGAVLVSSSWDSTVWRVGPDGALDAVWQGSSTPDSWHLNSLHVVDGRLHVCAFGRYDRFKGWKGETNASGFVHDVVQGVDVLGGLGHPHTPRFHDGHWYACESTKGCLTEFDAVGTVTRRAKVRRFTRGLAIVGRWALVGGNAHRKETEAEDGNDRAMIAVVDLDTFEVVERIVMPCLEIYDIVTVPFELARGVALGFGGNPVRSVEQWLGDSRPAEQRPTPDDVRVGLTGPVVAAKLAAAGQVQDSAVTRGFRVSVELPSHMRVKETRVLPVRIENRSRLPTSTVPRNPIRVGSRWCPEGEPEAQIRNPMSPLPRLLHPDEETTAEIVVVAPDEPGRYMLRVALHQPGAGWFGRRAEGEIEVKA